MAGLPTPSSRERANMMKTLCMYNLAARSVKDMDISHILRGRKYWGEVIFYSLQPEDISSPGWLSYLTDVSRVLIVGGDGTLHHAIQHLINTPVEIIRQYEL